MRRIAQWLLILALSLSIGLQWVVVQGVAWVGMMVANSRDATAMQSIAMTFDGRHECKVCRALDRGEEGPKKQSPAKEVKIHPMAAPLAEEFVFEMNIVRGATSAAPLNGAPPLPPPHRPPEWV